MKRALICAALAAAVVAGSAAPALADGFSLALSVPSTPVVGKPIVISANGTIPTNQIQYPAWFTLVAIPVSVTQTCPQDMWEGVQFAQDAGGAVIVLQQRETPDAAGRFMVPVAVTPSAPGSLLLCAYTDDAMTNTLAIASMRFDIKPAGTTTSPRPVSPAVQATRDIRGCLALLSGKGAKRCIGRAVRRANARCRRLPSHRRQTRCLRSVRRVAKPKASSSAAPAARVAHFKVTLTARQKVTWTQDITTHGCGGGIFRTQGHGQSTLTVRTPRPQRMTARLVRAGGREIALTFGDGTAAMPVEGTLTRDGSDSAVVIAPGTPGACPHPEPTPRDCGTKRLPAGSRIGIATESWLDQTVKHNGDVIYLTGPFSREWSAGPGFLHCLAIGRDDSLAGPATAGRPPRAALLVERVFGKRRHFVVTAQRTQTVKGTRPVTTTTSWRLSFTRVRR